MMCSQWLSPKTQYRTGSAPLYFSCQPNCMTHLQKGLESRINAAYGMDSVGPSVALVMVSNAGRFLPAERAMLNRGDRLGPLRGRW